MIRFKIKSLMEDAKFNKKGGRYALTLEAVARDTGIHRATLSKMIHHVGYNATTDSVGRLCRYFEVSVDKVIEYIPDEDAPDFGDEEDEGESSSAKE